MKIDVLSSATEKLEVISNRESQKYPPQLNIHPTESSNSSEDVSTLGDAVSVRDEFAEQHILSIDMNGFINQNIIYGGCPSPISGFIPYNMDGVQYQNPVVDYSFLSQPYCVSMSSAMQYPTQGNINSYVYAAASQPYQYNTATPPAYYFHSTPSNQYSIPTTPSTSLSPTGMMLIESQEQLLNGGGGCGGGAYLSLVNPYNIGSAIPPSYPLNMGPSPVVFNEAGAVSVVPYTTHTLRAAATPFVQPIPGKPKSWQKPGSIAEISPPQQITSKPVSILPPSSSDPNLPSTATSTSNTTKTANANTNVNTANANTNANTASANTNTNTANANTSANTAIPVVKSIMSREPDVIRSPDKSVVETVASSSSETALHLPSGQLKETWAVKARAGQYPMDPLRVSSVHWTAAPIAKMPTTQQYNRADFLTVYEDARFFVIKSYSEDNVCRSLQHGVWASTPNGNKKLDDAFQDAQLRAKGKPDCCPVFLFFSVNGSRQFCGVAEMCGPVDYRRTMEFWEQHKWSGSFPVKWHIIKDLPNSLFRRIILENNENKPVTNSRDTQQVNFQQGIEMLRIFKNYPLKTSMITNLNLHLPDPEDPKNERKLHSSFPQLPQRVSELSLKEKKRPETSKAPNSSAPLEAKSPNSQVETQTLKSIINYSLGQNEGTHDCPERPSISSSKG